MLRRAERLNLMAAGTSARVLFISTTSAASMATSVPAPMAMPISAEVRAGASLMPSPTMATLPFFLRSRITASLPSGRTPAMTSSTPASEPMAFALLSLSPVSITTWMPMLCSLLIAAGLSSRMASATAIKPKKRLPFKKARGVLPAAASSSAFFLSASDIEVWLSINFTLPPQRVSPCREAVRPFPGRAVKSETSSALKACSVP